MNKKVIQMVRYLQRDGAWVRGERLSAQFGVSTRQIRNYVSAANTSGCLISSSEKGYRLLDMNPSFRMLLDAEDNPESRLKRLLLVLLFSSEPEDIFTFSEQFYVSVPTMEADLQKLRRVLREYALEIVRERDLVWISGAEKTSGGFYAITAMQSSGMNTSQTGPASFHRMPQRRSPCDRLYGKNCWNKGSLPTTIHWAISRCTWLFPQNAFALVFKLKPAAS